jgi:hypothetical protein
LYHADLYSFKFKATTQLVGPCYKVVGDSNQKFGLLDSPAA